MRVSVVTPDASFFDGEARQVILPAWDGEMGILPGHAPLIAVLGHGVCRIDEGPGEGGKRTLVAVYGGFVKVQDDVVTVLAGGAARSKGELQPARAEVDAARVKLEALRTEGAAPSALAEAQETFKRAQARLHLEELVAGAA